MAEAAAVPPHRFFCHCCKGEVSPKLPEYICPRCDSGFIEEVTEDSSLLDSSSNGLDDTASQFAELWQLLFVERPFTVDLDSPDSEPRVPGGGGGLGLGGGAVWRVCPWWPRWGPRGSVRRRRRTLGARPSPTLTHSEEIPVQRKQPTGSISSCRGLLGQFENTGPPPADKEKISSLPTVIVSQEQADSNMECPRLHRTLARTARHVSRVQEEFEWRGQQQQPASDRAIP
ncbi:hypothetical protein MHYP_G00033180 [Metynnis hypsauchen]